MEIKSLGEPVAAMRGKKACPIIRVGENRADQIAYALDVGAKGIIIPMVNNKQDAINAVQRCKYHPDGVRSNSGVRGEWGEFEQYREWGLERGFLEVVSGVFVRSSYRAERVLEHNNVGLHKSRANVNDRAAAHE